MELTSLAEGQNHQYTETIREIAGMYTLCRYAPDPPGVDALRQAVKSFRPKREASG